MKSRQTATVTAIEGQHSLYRSGAVLDKGDISDLSTVTQPIAKLSGKPLQRLMTANELSQFLAVSTKTIQRLQRRGLPHYRIRGSVRFDPAKIERWLTEQEIGN